MNSKITRMAFLPILLFFSFLVIACSNVLINPFGNNGNNIPLYPRSEEMKIGDKIKENILVSFTNEGVIQNEHYINFSSTTDDINLVKSYYERELPKRNWKIKYYWNCYQSNKCGSIWEKEKNKFYVFIFGNLSQDEIREIQVDYGFQNLNPGNTLILLFLLNNDQQPQSQVYSQNATLTLTPKTPSIYDKPNHIASDILLTPGVFDMENTDGSLGPSVSKTELMPQQETNISNDQNIKMLSIDFSETSLTNGWTIEKEDPNHWDLTTRPGWLHLIGYPTIDSGYKNVFSQKITDLNLVIETKMEITDHFNDKYEGN